MTWSCVIDLALAGDGDWLGGGEGSGGLAGEGVEGEVRTGKQVIMVSS